MLVRSVEPGVLHASSDSETRQFVARSYVHLYTRRAISGPLVGS
jgi:hypothetical protein